MPKGILFMNFNALSVDIGKVLGEQLGGKRSSTFTVSSVVES